LLIRSRQYQGKNTPGRDKRRGGVPVGPERVEQLFGLILM
jgi:hypothetical protein